MIAILNDCGYFMDGHDNVRDFLVAYVENIGIIDVKAFRILASSIEMTVEELINYINSNCYNYGYKIAEIYELGKKYY